jgi:hypothetical protein
MRLLQSVRTHLKQTKQPQRKFVTHLLGLLLILPGHATFRNRKVDFEDDTIGICAGLWNLTLCY